MLLLLFSYFISGSALFDSFTGLPRMDKRNRLKITTPDASLIQNETKESIPYRIFVPTDQHVSNTNSKLPAPTIVLFSDPLDESSSHVKIPQTEIFQDEPSEPFIPASPVRETFIPASPVRETHPRKEINSKRTTSIFPFNLSFNLLFSWPSISFYLRSFLVVGFLSSFFYFIFKPSEYSSLIDEIVKLREEKERVEIKPTIKNLADFAEGATLLSCSPLWKYGFFKQLTTCPESIFDPGKDCLSLQGNRGHLKIGLKGTARIVRFGLYHPSFANPASGIKQARLTIGEKIVNIEFMACGYEEYEMNALSDSIEIEVISNHGEVRYTSIYRVYLYGFYEDQVKK